MKNIILPFLLIVMVLLTKMESKAQDSLRIFVNGGYITNLKKSMDSTKPDAGGSIRIGLLTRGRLGFYTGYLWFNEFNLPSAGYDDRGTAFLAGIDYLIIKSGHWRWYAQAGLEVEKFISEYPSRTETETNPKPDFGLLLNYKFVNGFLGWQPSEPSHFNIGIGFTIPVKKQ